MSNVQADAGFRIEGGFFLHHARDFFAGELFPGCSMDGADVLCTEIFELPRFSFRFVHRVPFQFDSWFMQEKRRVGHHDAAVSRNEKNDAHRADFAECDARQADARKADIVIERESDLHVAATAFYQKEDRSVLLFLDQGIQLAERFL